MSDAAGGILLTVAYDGRPFAGFVPQPGQRTVAGELLSALRDVDPSIREVRGASRTDSGVHALGQRVAFDPERDIPLRGWVLATARRLPPEIAIRRAAVVPRGFTPRFESRKKCYRYVVLRDKLRDPFFEGRAWRVEGLDDAAVSRAVDEAGLAIGTHDFAAFRSSSDQRVNTIRTIERVSVDIDAVDARVVRIEVEGNAFMHNMVRILVGTLVDVARKRRKPGAVSRALASHRREDLGITAPPEGLYLVSMTLSDEGTSSWPDDVHR